MLHEACLLKPCHCCCCCCCSYQLCLEYMVNHISPESPQFQDYLQNGAKSRFDSMFVKWRDIWPEGKGHNSNAAGWPRNAHSNVP
jgi:glycosidase